MAADYQSDALLFYSPAVMSLGGPFAFCFCSAEDTFNNVDVTT